jgi:fructokinase
MELTRHAVVLGEALIDLLDAELAGERVYRQVIGGAPLNVAVGIARLGGAVEFAGALGDDPFADRIIELLDQAGVGTRGTIRVPAPTALAVATHQGAEPDFRFYGQPPSYLQYGPQDLDTTQISAASVLYCGSISLLGQPFLNAARKAWETPGPLRILDPNVRPSLLHHDDALDQHRAVLEEFAATADLVKLSDADADALYGPTTTEQTLRHLRALGTPTVVITHGANGATISHPGGTTAVAAPEVRAVDTTGAGDSVMAALAYGLLTDGPPDRPTGWRQRVEFALHVAGVVVEANGGAAAMPTHNDLRRRFPDTSLPPSRRREPETTRDPKPVGPPAQVVPRRAD